MNGCHLGREPLRWPAQSNSRHRYSEPEAVAQYEERLGVMIEESWFGPCNGPRCCMTRLRTILIISIFTSSIIVAPLAGTSIYFVASWGVPAGDGTWENPLDLATALSSKSPAKPGDILTLRGGTYQGAFVSMLSGTENNPITIREVPEARVTIDGSLTVQGAWATYWDLEVTNSNGDRTKARPAGVSIFGPHTKFINLIVHDAGDGMEFWTPAVDAEIYGCLIYDNGWQGPDPDRGHGHGIYTQNQTGTKRIVDNVLFNGYGWGIHAYTEGGSLNGFHIEGNTVFNSGSATRQGHRYDNILVGVSGGGGGSHFGGPGGATPRMLDGGEWRQCGLVSRIPPFGRGFSRHRGLPIRWVFLESAEARASALRSSSR